jgi:hypothetical protein
MFAKPRGLVSARCHVGGHDSCIAERCDCDCHIAGLEFTVRMSGSHTALVDAISERPPGHVRGKALQAA